MNPDTQRQAEEERVLPETEWEQCPNCPNVGYYAAGDPQNPEQIQCEWCETNWKSPFYQTRNLPRILESLAVREREEREKAERKAELMKKAADRYLPCPDHRDKVNTAETGCPYCRAEVAESHEASEREKMEQLKALLAEAREALWNMNKQFRKDDCCNGTPKQKDCPCTLHKIRRAWEE